MLDLLPTLGAFLGSASAPQACAVATIVGTTGSVPRAVGTSMLVSEHGEVRGSLSGGCVEGAVLASCAESIATGLPRRERFGYSDDDAFAAGLMCGGSIEVHIQPFYPPGSALAPAGGRAPAVADADPGPGSSPAGLLAVAGPGAALALASDAQVSDGCALVRRIDGPAADAILIDDPLGFDAASIEPGLLAMLGEPGMARSAAAQLEPLVRVGHTGVIRIAPGRNACQDKPVELLVESRLPAPRMLVFGANDFASALIDAARPLGYHVVLCDARAAFATRQAFPRADELVVQWPHTYLEGLAVHGPVDPRTVVCVLTHDPKFDIPVLRTALEMETAYVGAMGSRASDRQRRAALLEAGVAPQHLARLRSPIGLDLGASSPQEVAVSITAEILAARYGKDTPVPLSHVPGPIH